MNNNVYDMPNGMVISSDNWTTYFGNFGNLNNFEFNSYSV